MCARALARAGSHKRRFDCSVRLCTETFSIFCPILWVKNCLIYFPRVFVVVVVAVAVVAIPRSQRIAMVAHRCTQIVQIYANK